MEIPRTFRIERGIGQYDFNDYYAVLGLPLTAEASHVRKRYLTIAKCLHPDIYGRTSDEKQIATCYLSKLVNPAYDVLSQERERTEYSAILKLLGKRLMKRNQTFVPQSEIAKKYLDSSKEINYEKVIQTIAQLQYQDLNKVLDNIGLLSELNLVHILIQEGYKHSPETSTNSGVVSSKDSPDIFASNTNKVNSAYQNNSNSSYQMQSDLQFSSRNTSNSSSQNTSKSNSSQSSSNVNNARTGSINQYINQAETYISQKLWTSALKELRIGIQIDCNNSKCHALLGFVYMNQKLVGMAKVSFQQSLKLNPEEPLALQYISQVGGTSSNGEKLQSEPRNEKKGGFFGWLGGG